MICTMIMGAMHAFVCIHLKADHTIAGTAINLVGLALATFLNPTLAGLLNPGESRIMCKYNSCLPVGSSLFGSSIIIFIVMCCAAAIFYGRDKDKMGKLLVPFYVYGTVIVGTFSIGIMLPFTIGPYGVVPAISAVLLVISDFMLAINKINKRKVLSDMLYLGYYFTGQFFMALSVFVPIVFQL